MIGIINDKQELKQLFREVLLENKDLLLPPKERIEPVKTQEKLITISGFCKLYDVSRMTELVWRKKGLLPFRRIGRRVYYIESEIYSSMQKIDFSQKQPFEAKKQNNVQDTNTEKV